MTSSTTDMLALSRALREGTGLNGIVTTLSRITRGPVAFVDMRGSLLASAPNRAHWPIDELADWTLDISTVGDPAFHVFPVTLSGDIEALLLVSDSSTELDVCQLATDLAALELARLQEGMAGRRELAGQVLEDIFKGVSRGAEARSRLSSLGVHLSTELGHCVVVGRCDLSSSRLKMRPWNLHSLLNGSGDPYVRATVDGNVVLVVPESGGVTAIARTLLTHLRTFDPSASVGIGPAAPDPMSLTMSYYQAREVGAIGGEVQHARPVNLGYFLLGSSDVLPLEVLSDKALQPIRDHDQRTGSELLRTLLVYLDCDCSVNHAAGLLFVHRNTLRYRLGTIADLTGWSVETFEGRLHFWTATRTVRSQSGTRSPKGGEGT